MKQEFIHSVTLNRALCKGCINCIKRCPTQAIRVRGGKAIIDPARCIDCAECIRICPHHAKTAAADPLSVTERFDYTIALPPPSFLGQFNRLPGPDLVVDGLLALGFDEVFEVGRAAELVSDATRRLITAGGQPLPLISSACPAVVRLIRVRYPDLLPHLLPLAPPVEVAARIAKRDAARRTGLAPERIGCVFLSPCPAKISYVRSPLGVEHSALDAAVSIKEIYPRMLWAMKQTPSEGKSQIGRAGVRWGESTGESISLRVVDDYLAADGIENVIRVLEDLEDEKLPGLRFVELNACAGGCVGGVLQVENPFIAKAKMKQLRRGLPEARSRLSSRQVPDFMRWDAPPVYAPVMELEGTRAEQMEKYSRLRAILSQLPGLDCGGCGAPTCEALAEDVVRGRAKPEDCTVLMRRRLEELLQERSQDDDQS